MKGIINRICAIWYILTIKDFILILAKKKDGYDYFKSIRRTDFEDIDDIKIVENVLFRMKDIKDENNT